MDSIGGRKMTEQFISIVKELVAQAFKPFEIDDNQCDSCPPSRYEPFKEKVIFRIFLLYGIFCFLDLNKWINRILFLMPSILIGLTVEAIYAIYFLGVNQMKTIIFGILSIAIIGISCYVVAQKPGWNNPLTNMLFSVLLAFTSIIVGSSINENKIRREGTNRWMPAAESACKELITISYTISKLQNIQSNLCKQLEGFLPSKDDGGSTPLKTILENKCQNCCSELTTIKNHVDKSIEDWEVFLSNNCEEGECEQIFSRLNITKDRLKINFERCVPEV